jgi:phage baseplate assembly protein W
MAKDAKLLQSEDGLFFGTYNDLIIENHDVKLIQGAEKIAQDVSKILLIERGTAPLFKNYGTVVSQYINGRKTTEMTSEITNEIIYAISYVKQINKAEAINIDSIQKLDVKDTINGFEIILNLLLTNGELLTVKKDYVR